jgi:hypothetical protein
MGPSRAMGLFVRRWRAEWVVLSRAQLAVALCGHLGRPGVVTPRVIRRWEEGQPPRDTGELEALCEVMARTGLPRHVADGFRSAVYVAVAERQYPEAFEGPPMARRSDVESLAAAMLSSYATYGAFRDPVRLVAMDCELRAAPVSGAAPQGKQQEMACRAALCYTSWLLAEMIGPLNWRLSAVTRESVATTVRDHFGGAPPGGVGALHPRVALDLALNVRAAHGRSLAAAESQLAVSRDESVARPPGDRAVGLLNGLCNLTRLGVHVYPELRPEAARAWEVARDSFDGWGLSHVRAAVLDTLCREGLPSEAEEHLAHLEAWRDPGSPREHWWYDYAATVEEASGRVRQAEELHAKGLEAARRHDDPFYERYFARRLGLPGPRGGPHAPHP